VKAVVAQVDPMGPDREDGSKGWVLIDDSGLLLLSCTSSGDAALESMYGHRQR